MSFNAVQRHQKSTQSARERTTRKEHEQCTFDKRSGNTHFKVHTYIWLPANSRTSFAFAFAFVLPPHPACRCTVLCLRCGVLQNFCLRVPSCSAAVPLSGMLFQVCIAYESDATPRLGAMHHFLHVHRLLVPGSGGRIFEPFGAVHALHPARERLALSVHAVVLLHVAFPYLRTSLR